jgi:AcrR family transcriptional regulator
VVSWGVKKGAPRRTRRTAAQARELILDAAERRLARDGPAQLRLQEIAADVGVSHPAILHHFGNRETLVAAVVERALERLRREVVTALTAESFGDADAAALLARLVRTLSAGGQARLLAWLALERGTHGDATRMLRGLAEVMHARRIMVLGREAPFEETLFVVVLASLAMIGEGILGPATWESAGRADDTGAPERFHAWLVKLLTDHLQRGARPTRRRGPVPAR